MNSRIVQEDVCFDSIDMNHCARIAILRDAAALVIIHRRWTFEKSPQEKAFLALPVCLLAGLRPYKEDAVQVSRCLLVDAV